MASTQSITTNANANRNTDAAASDVNVVTSAGSSSALPPPPGEFRATAIGDGRKRSVEKLIIDLRDVDLREEALAELSKKKQENLAPLLWFSFGTISILLQEIMSTYPFLSPPTLSLAQSTRVCNVIALFQCVASHPDTRNSFVKACMPSYLYSFLETTCETKAFAYPRLTSLGVIGALVKVPDTEVILFLLSSEIMPLCLRAMETGSEMSRTVATFIVQRILLDDVGLEYVCALPERLFAVNIALGNVLAALAENPSPRLLKHVIKCYLRFSQDRRSVWILRYTLPRRLINGTFDRCLFEDQTGRMLLGQLLNNVQGPPVAQEVAIAEDQIMFRAALKNSWFMNLLRCKGSLSMTLLYAFFLSLHLILVECQRFIQF